MFGYFLCNLVSEIILNSEYLWMLQKAQLQITLRKESVLCNMAEERGRESVRHHLKATLSLLDLGNVWS